MLRPYHVTFCTQRDRQYITWGLYLTANNQKEACYKASELWYSKQNPHYQSRTKDKPHMFHLSATRAKEEEVDHTSEKFYIIKNEYVYWGYTGKKGRNLW